MMASSALICTSCGDAEIELYFCETCWAENNDSSDSNEQELLCEACLTHHVKKGHVVKTSKGQEPLICSQHRRLHNQYCKTCDVTFCGYCLGKHSEHKMGSIDERAIEIKKEVFEMLTKLELDEKPLRAKKEKISELQESHECEQKQLRELVEAEIRVLLQKSLKRIDDNLQLLANEKEKSAETIEDVLRLQQKSRDLLSATSPHLIADFKRAKESYMLVQEAYSKALGVDYCAKSVDLNDVRKMVSDFGNEFVGKLTSVFHTIYPELVKQFAITASADNTFLFTVNNGLISVDKLSIRKSVVKVNKQSVGQVGFDGHIQSHYHITDKSTLCSVVLLSLGGCSYRLDVKDDQSCHLLEISKPSYKHNICAYTLPNSKETIYWCFWDEERRMLKFSHNSTLEVNCESVPTWKANTNSGQELCFLLRGNELLIVNPIVGKAERKDINLLNGIDHITILNTFVFLVWCAKSKSISLILKDRGDFIVVEVKQWDQPTEVVGLKSSPNLRFVPALPSSENSDELNYVFAMINY